MLTRTLGASKKESSFLTIIRNNAEKLDGIWCWQKICPGRSSIAEAKNAIFTSGGHLIIDYPDQLRADYPDGYIVVLGNNEYKAQPVDQIQIGFADGSSIGTLTDAVLNFGAPKVIVYDGSRGYPIGQPDVCFEGYLCVYVSSVATNTQTRLDPNLMVKEIDFFSSITQPTDADRAWRGFTSLPSQ